MARHLRAFQAVADSNGGNRASGLQGYGGTHGVPAHHAARRRLPAGRSRRSTSCSSGSPRTRSSSKTAPSARSRSSRTPTSTDHELLRLRGRRRGPCTPWTSTWPATALNTSGCETADFGRIHAGIALMQRGTCAFDMKVLQRRRRPARAPRWCSTKATRPRGRRDGHRAGPLGAPPDVTSPPIRASFADGQSVRHTPGPARVHDQDLERPRGLRANVSVDTPGGDPAKVILVGSHLDSVPEGPGINDNGSGSAFNLETAIQMAKLRASADQPGPLRLLGGGGVGPAGGHPLHRGAGLRGSPNIAHESQLRHARLAELRATRLRRRLLGYPCAGLGAHREPGCCEDRAKTSWSTSTARGLATEPTAFDGRSDYKPFQDNGIPAGGLFTGAEGTKTAEQAVKWGGPGRHAVRPQLPPARRHDRQRQRHRLRADGRCRRPPDGALRDPGHPVQPGGGMKAPSAAKVQRQVASPSTSARNCSDRRRASDAPGGRARGASGRGDDRHRAGEPARKPAPRAPSLIT